MGLSSHEAAKLVSDDEVALMRFGQQRIVDKAFMLAWIDSDILSGKAAAGKIGNYNEVICDLFLEYGIMQSELALVRKRVKEDKTLSDYSHLGTVPEPDTFIQLLLEIRQETYAERMRVWDILQAIEEIQHPKPLLPESFLLPEMRGTTEFLKWENVPDDKKEKIIKTLKKREFKWEELNDSLRRIFYYEVLTKDEKIRVGWRCIVRKGKEWNAQRRLIRTEILYKQKR